MHATQELVEHILEQTHKWLKSGDVGPYDYVDNWTNFLGEPDFLHPVEMAQFLRLDSGVRDMDVIAAALLHDTVEDSELVTSDLLHRLLPATVADIVDQVTDDRSPGVTQVMRKRAQVEHAHTMSRGARIVKAADMWHNLSSLLDVPPPTWAESRVQGYFRWKYEIFTLISEDLPDLLNHALKELFDNGRLKSFDDHPALASKEAEALESYYQTHCDH